ncbi:MAG: helix-turn-helix transcriptional regulator, partial [Nitriliruptorales bacterium]|nr:helix-turn-helix transcriptional regulator [Nitriliruptorales bacterium]
MAVASIRRALTETTERLDRARLLPVGVQILLAVGDGEAARGACAELEEIAARQPGALLEALAAEARGAVELAGGDAPAALVVL